MQNRIKILFLCTGNSCRSQMAEGFCKHLSYTWIDCFSAGIVKHGLNPLAVKVMSEIGIDISNHLSKTVDEIDEKNFDYVITVCGHANENCPYFPAGTGIIHRGFDDPPRLAENAETEEEALQYYRRVRDEIRNFILEFPDILSD
ncbi:MAG: arsenate reductase ArsC [Candidatus Fermentibacteria bacterium]